MSAARRESTLEGEWDAEARRDETVPSTSGSSSLLEASDVSDGFLGGVAKWRDDGSSLGARTSRMTGSKLGASPPPPPGPPREYESRLSRCTTANCHGRITPTPLPPASAHPFASAVRPSQSGLPNAHFSSLLPASHKRSNSRPGSPSGPPPTGGLPPVPTATGEGHARNRSKGGMLDSLPVAPTGGAGAATHLSPPSQLAGDQHPVGGVGGRTPSRHLLQTALDLAQKAVEMDRDNDVKGALAAYREAVARLKSVMERVGMEGGDERRKRGGGGSGKTEEEGRTLKGIHDAYVARILLLSSYEAGPAQEQVPVSQRQAQQPASTSSSIIADTLQSSGTGLPRSSSLDDGAMAGIGSLMLVDESEHQGSGTATSLPQTEKTDVAMGEGGWGVEVGQSPRLPSVKGMTHGEPSLQQALDQAAEGATASLPRDDLPPAPAPAPAIGLGYPSSSPAYTLPLSPSSRRNRKSSRPSMGLDMEADLSGIDGVVEGVEVLATTPTEGVREGRPSQTPSPQHSVHSQERPLPPLPPESASPAPLHGAQVPSGRKASLSDASVPIQAVAGTFLVSPSTKQGTISQRRQSRTPAGEMDRPGQQGQGQSPKPNGKAFPGSAAPTAAAPAPSRRMSSSSLGLAFGRTRAKSQPGGRLAEADLPPVPTTSTVRHQPSFSLSSSQMSMGGAASKQPPVTVLQQVAGGAGGTKGLRINTDDGRGLAPPAVMTSQSGSTAYSFSSYSPRSLGAPLPDTTLGGGGAFDYSAHLEPQPAEEVLRPFHVLRILRQSMNRDGQGASLTPGIYIHPGMWSWSPHSAGSSAPPKIVGQDVKVRCMHALFLGLEGVRGVGVGLLEGPRGYSRKEVAVDEAKRKMGEEFCRVLEELEEEMDSAAKMLGKGGVAVGEWKGKKSSSTTKSWGSRISRGMDKISNSKTIDTPEKYVENLQYLCSAAQVINQHLLNYVGLATPAYASLPERPYREIEVRLRRTSDFVGRVVVPFVLEDFKAFMIRYLKGGMRYLEE